MQDLETEKLMDELDLAYHRRDLFLERVRTAYRELVLTLPENSIDTCRVMCQDGLSLYSPWMNANFMTLEEFTNRFNAELERILGFTAFKDGSTVRRYSDAVAESYFVDETFLDEDGNRDPEECARVDYSYWDD